jgi:hypothetical protein
MIGYKSSALLCVAHVIRHCFWIESSMLHVEFVGNEVIYKRVFTGTFLIILSLLHNIYPCSVGSDDGMWHLKLLTYRLSPSCVLKFNTLCFRDRVSQSLSLDLHSSLSVTEDITDFSPCLIRMLVAN